LKNKLSETDFPYIERDIKVEGAIKNVIVFVLGGTTFEEAREVAELNISDPQMNIILGGTTVHNSKTFIAECTDIRNI